MKITVQKYDPSIDDAPYDIDYDVEWHEHISLLEALVAVDEGFDEGIAFDYTCRGRMCGRCSCMLDGEPVNACWKILEDKDYRVSPLEGHPIVRDLMVDKSDTWASLSRFETRVWPKEETDDDVLLAAIPEDDMETYHKVHDLEWCARCLCCNAICPAYNMEGTKFLGPAGFRVLAYRYYDPYDQGDRVMEAVQGGLFNCILCGQCDDVCPADEIDHVGFMQDLMDAAEARGLKPED